MAAAPAQTPIADLSSSLIDTGSRPHILGEAEGGACGVAFPSLATMSMEASSTCVDVDAGLAAHVPSLPCSDPHGADARAVPVLLGPDGRPYPGRLLDDILEYRSLRANMLAGNHIDTDAHARYLALEGKLRAHENAPTERAHLRAFHRFDLRLDAGVRFRIAGQRILVQAAVENISAGGVKLSMPDIPHIGEAVWLQMRLGSGPLAILPSRVVWARGHVVGLMFAGAPRWS